MIFGAKIQSIFDKIKKLFFRRQNSNYIEAYKIATFLHYNQCQNKYFRRLLESKSIVKVHFYRLSDYFTLKASKASWDVSRRS